MRSHAYLFDPIEVRGSAVHGRGVFATRSIVAGSQIGVYTGRLYRPGEANGQNWNHDLTYVFGLSDGSLIDGAEGGNATRHINHSCEPNCVAWETEDERGTLGIVIEARRRIQAGEELFLDYDLDVGAHDPAAYPCHCGARRCRGTLAARQQG